MLWQLVPTESDLDTIDVKAGGALLLGQGQRASPGILIAWSVPRVAARVQANVDRVQVTSLSSCIRVWQNEQVTKLTRGQTVLLQTGDTLDISSIVESDSPASEATYMLVESLLETLPAAPIDSAVRPIKVEPGNMPPALPASTGLATAADSARQVPACQLPGALAASSPIQTAAASTSADGQTSVTVSAAPLVKLESQAAGQQLDLSQPPVPVKVLPGRSPVREGADGHDAQGQVSMAASSTQNVLSGSAQSQARIAAQVLPPGKVEVADDADTDMLASSPKENVPPADQQSVQYTALAPLSSSKQPLPAALDGSQAPAKDQFATQQHASIDAMGNADMTPADHEQPAPAPASKDDGAAAQQAEASADAAETLQTSDVTPRSVATHPEQGEQAGTRAPELASQQQAGDQHARTAAEPVRASKHSHSKSGADIFDSTIAECQKVLDKTQAVLLEKPSSSSEPPSSHIAAAERVAMWHKELQGLVQQCKRPKLYIGVVGDTGAGKSSTINCLLEEENIVPVNGMRACTACVVEISHIPSSMYEGTVECMTREEWHAQAKGLWQDLVDERGRLRINRDPDRRLNTSSVEGAAQATLETVYGPHLLRRSGITLEKLFTVTNKVTQLLGCTINIRESAAKHFRKRIGEYVDSHNKKDEIQAWPLVKVCKLRHNWKVLSTGAVVVDLPGVRDANAARGAVAEKYMKSCNAIWIVADITRAVDNRTAKDLLGESFRRQMLMDGQYGSISFICTKTDQIQVSETVRAFRTRAEMCELANVPLEKYQQAQQKVDERQSEVNRLHCFVKSCKKNAGKINKKVTGIRRRLANIDKKATKLKNGEAPASGQNRAAEESESDSEDSDDSAADSEPDSDAGSGGEEYVPGDKRKAKKGSSSRSKRRRKSSAADEGSDSDLELAGFFSDDDAGSGSGSDAEGSDDGDVNMAQSPARNRKLPRTLEALEQEAAELTVELNAKVQAVKVLRTQQTEAQAQADKAERKLSQAQLIVKDICARARIAYSKRSLKKDFKDGLTELEETAAFVDMDAREGTSGAAEPVPQVRAKAQETELPVFCVSATDCQKLEGRAMRNGPPDAFTRLEHTEMPQLRAHVHHVTEQGRLHAAGSLASGLSHFINATAVTLTHHGTIQVELQDACTAVFNRELQGLQKEAKILLDSFRVMLEQECTQGSINPRLESGVEVAENKAVATSSKWSAHKLEGGLMWATYKATVRPARNGVYKSSARGEINFNGDLARPILDGISMAWETLFGTTIVTCLKQYRADVASRIKSFLEAVKDSLSKLGVEAAKLTRIISQVQAHEAKKSGDLIAKTCEDIQARQRDMSREVIEPTVQDAMTQAYAACCAEAGTGQFERMKRLMRAAVEQQKESMFQEAAAKLEASMKDMVAGVAETLSKGQAGMASRVANMFAILWETPACSKGERKAALAGLQELAGQMQGVCRGAGAPVLELTLPKEEEHEVEQALLRQHKQEEGAQMSAQAEVKQEQTKSSRLAGQALNRKVQTARKSSHDESAYAAYAERMQERLEHSRQAVPASNRSIQTARKSSQDYSLYAARPHQMQEARKPIATKAARKGSYDNSQYAAWEHEQQQKRQLQRQQGQRPRKPMAAMAARKLGYDCSAYAAMQRQIEPAHQTDDVEENVDDDDEEEDEEEDIPEEDRQTVWYERCNSHPDLESDGEEEDEEEESEEEVHEDERYNKYAYRDRQYDHDTGHWIDEYGQAWIDNEGGPLAEDVVSEDEEEDEGEAESEQGSEDAAAHAQDDVSEEEEEASSMDEDVEGTSVRPQERSKELQPGGITFGRLGPRVAPAPQTTHLARPAAQAAAAQAATAQLDSHTQMYHPAPAKADSSLNATEPLQTAPAAATEPEAVHKAPADDEAQPMDTSESAPAARVYTSTELPATESPADGNPKNALEAVATISCPARPDQATAAADDPMDSSDGDSLHSVTATERETTPVAGLPDAEVSSADKGQCQVDLQMDQAGADSSMQHAAGQMPAGAANATHAIAFAASSGDQAERCQCPFRALAREAEDFVSKVLKSPGQAADEQTAADMDVADSAAASAAPVKPAATVRPGSIVKVLTGCQASPIAALAGNTAPASTLAPVTGDTSSAQTASTTPGITLAGIAASVFPRSGRASIGGRTPGSATAVPQGTSGSTLANTTPGTASREADAAQNTPEAAPAAVREPRTAASTPTAAAGAGLQATGSLPGNTPAVFGAAGGVKAGSTPGTAPAATKGANRDKGAGVTPKTASAASEGASGVKVGGDSPEALPATSKGTSGMEAGGSAPGTAPAALRGAKAAGSTPEMALPLSAYSSSAAKGSRQRWMGKASSLLGGWAVPGVKVKKERKAAGNNASGDVIDLT